jgi:hypothetical protein
MTAKLYPDACLETWGGPGIVLRVWNANSQARSSTYASLTRETTAAAYHHRLRLSTTGPILTVSESRQRSTRIRVARQELGIAKHSTLASSASMFMRVGSSAARRKPLRDVVESACIRKGATRERAALWGNISLTRDRTRQLDHTPNCVLSSLSR